MATLKSFVGKASRKMVNTLIKEIQVDYDFYENVCLADPTVETAASVNAEHAIGVNISSHASFHIVSRGKLASSDALTSHGTGKPVFYISLPATEKGGEIGVLFGTPGFACMFTGQVMVIEHPDKSKILSINFRALDYESKLLSKRGHHHA